MKKISFFVLVLVILLGGYLFWTGTAQFALSQEGYPVPRNAVFKETIAKSEGPIYVYTVPGLHQTDGLSNSYKRQFEKHGWTYTGDLSEGATYVFKKADGTLLNVSIYEGEMSISQLQSKKQ
ncbi:hypothetical protein ACWGPW_14765 [Paenibacillus chitinolyticus]